MKKLVFYMFLLGFCIAFAVSVNYIMRSVGKVSGIYGLKKLEISDTFPTLLFV